MVTGGCELDDPDMASEYSFTASLMSANRPSRIIRNATAFATLLLVAAAWVPPTRAQPAIDKLEDKLEESIGNPDPATEAPASAAPVPNSQQRGYLGVVADDRLDNGRGVRIQDVVAGGPADRAGLKIGDLVTALDTAPIKSMNDFGAALVQARPDQRIAFTVARGDRSYDLAVSLGHYPPPGARPVSQSGVPGLAFPPRRRLLGVRTLPITEEARRFFNLSNNSGALVSEIVPGSPAEKAGLPLDAIVVAVDGQPVADPNELARLIEAAGAGREIELSYYSRGAIAKSKVQLAEVTARPAALTPRPEPVDETAPPESASDNDVLRENDELRERVKRLEQRLQRLEALLRQMTQPGVGPGVPPGNES